MTLVFIIAAFALGGVLFLYYLARGEAAIIKDMEDLGGRTQPVDLDAFRNLIDPEQDRFLRRELSPPDFRRIQRLRIWAMIEYVERIAHNAAVLLRLGEAARKNANAEVAVAAQDTIDAALRVRIFSMLALAKLYTQVVLPGIVASSSDIFRRYQQLTYAAVLLARLQRPTYAGRLSSLL